MNTDINRRSFVKTSLLSTAGLALALDTRGQTPSPLPLNPPLAPSGLPKGRIGKLEVSRILLGGNLLTHYTHSRDLRYVYNLAAHYNTDEKIMETLALAEKHGVNTLSMHNPAHPMSVLRRYRKERGGKIQWIICPTAQIDKETAEVMQAVQKPWIAFKVMAAGAIPPKDALQYAFQNGADFALAGMFDFEIAEDVKIASEVLAGVSQRARPWRA